MSYQCTKEEQETTVWLGRLDNYAILDTTDSVMITKIKKLLNAKDTEWELLQEDNIGLRVRAPKNLIMLGVKTRTKDFTKEQKAAASKRIREYNEARRLNKG